MVEFSAFETGIEVNGETVLSVVDGMGAFRYRAAEILAEHGIVEPTPGQWYPQQAWLDAFRTIAEKIGNNTVYSIGRKIPSNATFPPDIKTIDDALAAIDVAYHMNHRKGGVVLFDGATGKMREGIGHYIAQRLGPKQMQVRGENPYPCDFDRGIVTAMAERFRPAEAILLRVVHADGPCRRRGDECCDYSVVW